jgi:hypothetical protein
MRPAVLAVVAVFATTTLVALPDLISGAGEERTDPIEVSPIDGDGAEEPVGIGGDRAGPPSREHDPDGGASVDQPKSRGRRPNGRASAGTGAGASAPLARPSGPASSGSPAGGGGGGGGGGAPIGGGEGGDDGGDDDGQPAPSSPTPAQPAPPPPADDDGDVGDVGDRDDADNVDAQPDD